jgi:secreted Zn-dependent insulinase-like peptidase
VEPLPQELKAALGLASSSSDGDCGSNGDCDSNGAAVNSSKGVSSAEAADAARQQQLDISAIRQHLHLPEPNWAIPKDLALKPPAAGAAVTPDSATTTTTTTSTAASASGRPVSVHPAVAAQSPSLSLWHHQDTSFAIPKTHLYWHLVTPCVYASPTSLVTSRLLCRLLHDLLLPDTYHAELAGTHWELSTAATGLLLHVWGFSDVVGGLQGRVLRALAGLSLEQVQAWWVA